VTKTNAIITAAVLGAIMGAILALTGV